MGWIDGVRDWVLAPLLAKLGAVEQTRVKSINQVRQYRVGQQRDMLAVKYGQTDDNIVLNFCGLAVDRSLSLLFGKGVQFNLPGDGETPESKYLAATLDANKQQILFHRLGLLGAEGGMCYLWFIPQGVIGRDGQTYTRLVTIDPEYVTVETEPEDIEIVRRYLVQYPVTGANGKPAMRKKVVERSSMAPVIDSGSVIEDADNRWTTTDYLVQEGGEVITGQEHWPYDFPPILHWQNMPSVGSVYGQPDITEDVIRLQDRVNFTAANLSKIIRIYANPQRFSRMAGEVKRIEIGPDKMPNFEDPNGGIFQLEALGDLAAGLEVYDRMERAIFAVTRTIDPSDLAKQVGGLTNFGLRVMYQDALQKLATKRELYGDALTEMARRLLVIGAFANPDPGTLIWPEALPENETDVIQGLGFDLANGLTSKQTASQKRGYDWKQEQARISEEQTNQSNSLALALLERERAAQTQFDRGQQADDENPLANDHGNPSGRSGDQSLNEVQ
jgi:hypothetical protein